MAVLDATPLIYLASIDRLALCDELATPPVTPEPVYEEVVTTGIEAGYPDARRIERVVEEGVVAVVETPETRLFERLGGNSRLSEADAAVLAAAADRSEPAIVDDRYARVIADAEGIETRGTTYVVLRSLREGVIDADDARTAIDGMVEAGWYCGTDLYARILRKIEELQ